MAGTRRHLFKTSILSALGLASLGAITRAAAQTAAAPGRSPKDFTMLAECADANGTTWWILLQPTSFGIEAYTVSWNQSGPNFDLNKITSNATLRPAGNITVTTKASYAGDQTATLIIKNSYLQTPAAGASPLNGLAQTTWNEIGSRHTNAR